MLNNKLNINLINVICVIFVFAFAVCFQGFAFAEETNSTKAEQNTPPPLDSLKISQSLSDIQIALTTAETISDIGKLSEDAQSLIKHIDEYAAYQRIELEVIENALVALGESKPIVVQEGEESAIASEDKAITKKRESLLKQQEVIRLTIEEASAQRTLVNEVIQQIAKVRQQKFKTQLATKSQSIISRQFWQPIFEPTQAQNNRLNHFKSKISASITQVVDNNLGYAVLIVLFSCTLWTVIRLWAEKLLYKFSIKYIPFGRFRRSFVVIAIPVVTILSTIISLNLFFRPILSQSELSPIILDFINQFIQLAAFCALVTGLGRAFLANKIQSRRLVNIPDDTAKKLAYFPVSIAIVALFFGTIEIINNVTGVIVGLTIWSTGLSAILIALLMLVFPVRIYHTHNNDDELNNTSKQGLIHVLILISSLFIIVTALLGYISLSTFVAYQTLWIAIVIIAFYCLKHFSQDFWQAMFYPANRSAKFIKQTLNLNDRLLEQIKVVLTALSNCGLIIILIMALLNGSFSGATTQTLFDKLLNLLTENGLAGFGIVPANLTNAVVILLVSSYVLRSSKRWLSKEFLPKTNVDIGIAASLVTLYSNIGYVLVIMFTLAALGIQWSNLAWIVSALSVGIGFGLQEIVKNFISGIILLTERPVKVGDSIGIAGIEGDIKRINVRATEIQLSDRSTVIVPNSQLIAQNVKNNSKNNPKGVVSIELNFAINSDPEVIQTILLDAYKSHPAILNEPAPEVRFSQLNSTAMNLTITGSVQSPRLVGKTKSDLLFIILKGLRKAEIYPNN
ncbi:DUF3772 domain-containing protein [Thorsellia anophelis]|uniref:Small-conductance mechanosensitive channel n=1 Tax=Thorsellia anophelis DSM 18579 TaxID=1123402 RepID=A0A1H9ZS14_9GAMM|nr:DUF3772 domain-containing protein [Thorsellia anophelis]SES83617.1 Small-conductance mechanosensitive channel [Thorsellia anophelis DSM 18579]